MINQRQIESVNQATFSGGSPDLFAQLWDSKPTIGTATIKAAPASLNFTATDIYGSRAIADSQAPTAPADLIAGFSGANVTSIEFTTPAQDAKSGKQPDFYLNTEGKLIKNPRATPSADGSVKIEVEGNNSAAQAKQYADKLQKQAISDLVSAFKKANPGTKVPEMWQSILDSQPDTNYPNTGDSQNNNTVTPAEQQAYDAQSSPSPPLSPTDDLIPTTQLQPEPSEFGSSGGGSNNGGSGGGGRSGEGGGGRGAGGGGDSTATDGNFSGSLGNASGDATSTQVVQAAESQLGVPYVWDHASPRTAGSAGSFDCSGLTMWAWKQAGVDLPHNADAQYHDTAHVSHVPLSQLQPGDLLFYNDGGSIHHVAMYAGNGKMIEAPDVGLTVREVPVRTHGLMAMAGRPHQ